MTSLSGLFLQFAGLAARFPGITALLIGVIAALGFPPLHLWPLTLLAIGALAAMIRTAPTRRAAFRLGWMFGVGHFTMANNWIAQAFTYQDSMPPMLGWIAVPLLSLYLAIYPALATWAAWELAKRARITGPQIFGVCFAGMWIISEWLRSWVFTGYAWDPLGLVFLGGFNAQGIAVLLPFVGTYALSGLVVLIAAALMNLLLRRRWIVAGGGFAVAAAVMLFPSMGQPPKGDVPFTLVQPDVRQPDLDNPAKFEEQFMRIAQLSAPREPVEGRLVMWPESGVPDYLEDGYPQRYYDRMTAGGDPAFARWRIGRSIGDDAMLLTGAVNLDIAGGRAVTARNSVTAISSEGE
ncbi:apolipoprotein N-acyltransferase, partial [Sphingomonadaceae bacterium]|nr:apolipoprotein N-acyltransferase [Sphingomonadaceae bacterium]